MSIAQQINFIVEKLPEEEQILIFELVKRISHEDTMIIEKSDDDILTEEDIADIEQARLEYARGETIKHEDINWD